MAFRGCIFPQYYKDTVNGQWTFFGVDRNFVSGIWNNNFADGVVPECGGGVIWNTPEIILTAVVAVIVAAYVIYLLVGIKPFKIEALLNERENTEQNNNE